MGSIGEFFTGSCCCCGPSNSVPSRPVGQTTARETHYPYQWTQDRPPERTTYAPVSVKTFAPKPVFPPRNPVIGILVEKEPEKGGDLPDGTHEFQASTYVNRHPGLGQYVRDLEGKGGIVRWILNDEREASEALDGVHGLLIPDGSGKPDPFEIDLARMALKKKLPIRAIRRGHEILNVAGGGTLIEDIPAHLNHKPPYDRLSHGEPHGIVVLPGSRLQAILGAAILQTQSPHHQAVGAVAPGFVPVAYAADRIVEAIEKEDNPTVLGIEFVPNETRERFIGSLVEDARDYWDQIEPRVAP